MLLLEAGLIDGLNPCFFTLLVFFVVFLSSMRFSYREKNAAAFLFVIAVFITLFFVRLGYFESIRKQKWMLTLTRGLLLGSGGAFLILGVVHLRDWWIYLKTENTNTLQIQFPFFLQKESDVSLPKQKRTLFSWLALMLAALAIGFLSTIIASVFPTSIYPAFLFYSMTLQDMQAQSMAGIIMYTLFSVIPLILAYALILWAMHSPKTTPLLRKCISSVKIIAAAVLLGLGGALIYLCV